MFPDAHFASFFATMGIRIMNKNVTASDKTGWTQMEDVEKFLTENAFMPVTIEGYRRVLQTFDTWLGERGLTVNQCGPSEILAFMDSRKWGAAARHKCSAAIRSYVKWRFGNTHPILALKIRRPPVSPHRTLSEEKLVELLDSFNLDRPTGLRDFAIVMLMVETGLRKSEIPRLTLDTVDLDKRRLDVLVKGGEWGSGVFSQETANTLDDWLGIRPIYARPDCKAFFCAIGGHHAGCALTSNGIGMIFKTMARRAGFAISPHDLRRTMACLLTLRGAPTEIVRQAGRWHNLEQVKTYTQMVGKSAVDPYLPMPHLGELLRK
jgi:integrase/recombinase XerD